MEPNTSVLGKPPTNVVAAIRGASARDNWRNALFLAGDWAVMAAAGAAHVVWGGPALYALALVVVGVRMRALGNLLHEAAHFKLFADRTVNAAVGRMLCGWPIFVGFARYTATHRLHHTDLWQDGRDPDVRLYVLSGTEHASSDRLSYPAFLVRHVLLVLIPVMPARRLLMDARAWRPAVVAGVAAGITVAWLLYPPLGAGLLLYWIVPWLTTYQMCSYWAELGEHGGLRSAGRSWGSRNWRGNAITRWAIGSHSDDLYHLLHHWFPSVPHHRLRDLDRICQDQWPTYAAENRCSGFFFGTATGVSVLRDIWTGGRP